MFTRGTVFAPSTDNGGLDTLTLGTVGLLLSKSDPQKKIDLGNLKPHYADSLTKNELKPRITYHFGITSGYLDTTWWCWGDLEGDLKDKKLSAWQEGTNFEKAEKPTPEQVEKEGWVLGANPAKLALEDKTGSAEFQFVD